MLGSLWRFAVRTAAGAVALWVVIKLIDGISLSLPTTPLYQDGRYDNVLVFLAVAAIIVVLNATVKPVLNVLGLPLTILSLGLFALFINAAIFLLAEWVSNLLALGLSIDSFGAAFVGAIVLTLVNWVLGPIIGLLGAGKD
ncbi:hypothetical protein CDES_01225 [Corynebacterium deserti GIMN1.010]|uniref:Phage holin family protein n=1 Tax=Corynebacterium deserti GIMN1.010 TaxID=931089 RepID=A0A0M5IQN3_9CORY|nr:phage holin family protein [Corynebacterium deserti]ALC04724.1 hypothetical protein CDES_01225 [Corynebacterium deserti GIMN1.010]